MREPTEEELENVKIKAAQCGHTATGFRALIYELRDEIPDWEEIIEEFDARNRGE